MDRSPGTCAVGAIRGEPSSLLVGRPDGRFFAPAGIWFELEFVPAWVAMVVVVVVVVVMVDHNATHMENEQQT